MKVQISDIDEGVWRKARVTALGMGKTMGEFVELALKDLMYVATPGTITVHHETKPTPDTSIPMASCKRCADKFPVADMITEKKTGFLFCVDCVENMKNGQ